MTSTTRFLLLLLFSLLLAPFAASEARAQACTVEQVSIPVIEPKKAERFVALFSSAIGAKDTGDHKESAKLLREALKCCTRFTLSIMENVVVKESRYDYSGLTFVQVLSGRHRGEEGLVLRSDIKCPVKKPEPSSVAAKFECTPSVPLSCI
ncbi:MAG: hypothetical protein HYY96_14310 [Candidatus Tectomicrobia bacterium]|nr:hypothetical protein [Candidatus Tectomicrobia bacterium]